MKLLDRLIGNQIRQPDGWAGRLLGHLMALEHRPLTRWAFDQLDLHHDDRVLELGCGNGAAIKVAASHTLDGYVVGIDYAPYMVRAARRRTSHIAERGQATVLQADVAALPFAPASFQKAFAIETFYFWPDPQRNLAGILSLLTPGGRLVLAMDISKEGRDQLRILDSAHRLDIVVYSREELATLLQQAGFVEVEVETKPDVGQGWILASGTRPATPRQSSDPPRPPSRTS